MKPYINVHIAILLFGFAGLFPKLINLNTILIIQGRTLFAFIIILIFLFFKESILLPSLKYWFWMIGTGLILALHWIFFFKSIQITSISFGVLTFSIYPIFVLFFEKFFF